MRGRQTAPEYLRQRTIVAANKMADGSRLAWSLEDITAVKELVAAEADLADALRKIADPNTTNPAEVARWVLAGRGIAAGTNVR